MRRSRSGGAVPLDDIDVAGVSYPGYVVFGRGQ